MPCCGQKRRALREMQAAIAQATTVQAAASASAAEQVRPQPASPPAPHPISTVLFEYTGRTALTVVGPVSGQRYHFARPGDSRPVHRSDAVYLDAVPKLRRCLTAQNKP